MSSSGDDSDSTDCYESADEDLANVDVDPKNEIVCQPPHLHEIDDNPTSSEQKLDIVETGPHDESVSIPVRDIGNRDGDYRAKKEMKACGARDVESGVLDRVDDGGDDDCAIRSANSSTNPSETRPDDSSEPRQLTRPEPRTVISMKEDARIKKKGIAIGKLKIDRDHGSSGEKVNEKQVNVSSREISLNTASKRNEIEARSIEGREGIEKMSEAKTVTSFSNPPPQTESLAPRNDRTSQGTWFQSFLTTATSSVSALTSTVSDGLNIVIENVDSKLGAPNPDELARRLSHVEIKEATNDTTSDLNSWTVPFWNKQDISKMWQDGLGILETVGRKTVDVLQENKVSDLTGKLTKYRESGAKTLSELANLSKSLDKSEAPTNSQLKEPDFQTLRNMSRRSAERNQVVCVRNPKYRDFHDILDSVLTIVDDDYGVDNWDDCLNNYRLFVADIRLLATDDETTKTFEAAVQLATANVKRCQDSQTIDAVELVNQCSHSLDAIYRSALMLMISIATSIICTDDKTDMKIDRDCVAVIKQVMQCVFSAAQICTREYVDALQDKFENEDRKFISEILADVYIQESDCNSRLLDCYRLLKPCLIEAALNSDRSLDHHQ